MANGACSEGMSSRCGPESSASHSGGINLIAAFIPQRHTGALPNLDSVIVADVVHVLDGVELLISCSSCLEALHKVAFSSGCHRAHSWPWGPS
ncbi:hypothetical protein C8034_v005884 [Colletotrichum sidae]|uniref:Uncharacterized protein n=1 Tax=Colletotrichum sidae TaxID=1347389 RepID=A0A4R8TQ87_9PEZI|nr:hypothetical protein C8034_v005884 [Colletotrichum sidae]